jgi:two-component system, NarL family, nitrate/nitrite response regulator NarL
MRCRLSILLVAFPIEESPPHVGLQRLSPREAQVLESASRGLTNEQVAEQLQVTVHAVKFHLASIYRKLQVANRTEAANVYMRAALTRGIGGTGG